MTFAVFDPSPLTMSINCSFLHLFFDINHARVEQNKMIRNNEDREFLSLASAYSACWTRQEADSSTCKPIPWQHRHWSITSAIDNNSSETAENPDDESDDESDEHSSFCNGHSVQMPAYHNDPSNSNNADRSLLSSSRSFACCKPFQTWFFVQLCSSLQDFNWHIARRAVPQW